MKKLLKIKDRIFSSVNKNDVMVCDLLSDKRVMENVKQIEDFKNRHGDVFMDNFKTINMILNSVPLMKRQPKITLLYGVISMIYYNPAKKSKSHMFELTITTKSITLYYSANGKDKVWQRYDINKERFIDIYNGMVDEIDNS